MITLVTLLVIVGVILGIVVLVAFAALNAYTVVEPNKAHIVVFGGKGRKVYTPHVDEGKERLPTAYFFIPPLMKRIVLPLNNVKMEIPQFELNDAKVAPFVCEAVCWFRIEKPEVAVEKIDVDEAGGFESAVESTLEEQVKGITRAAAMKQEILEIMRDRISFGDYVVEEVNGALEEWGLEIVKLEIVDFSDDKDSNVIADYENMRKSQISSASRKEQAQQNRDAEVVEASSEKTAGVAKAESEREIEKANIEREKQVKIAEQTAEKEIATKAEEANRQKVEATRTMKVGEAAVEKEAVVEIAEGKAEAVRKEGRAAADVIQQRGLAMAEVIKQQGLSKAVSTDKMAEALKKYNEAGISLEQLKAFVEIQKSKFEHLGKALEAADLKFNIVGGGESANLFGFDLGAESGAGIAQMMQAFESTYGKSPKDLISKVAKKFLGNKNAKTEKKQKEQPAE